MEDMTLAPLPDPGVITINGRGGRTLLSIHPDGTVDGEIKDAGPAAKAFLKALTQWKSPAEYADLVAERDALKQKLTEWTKFWEASRKHGVKFALSDYDLTSGYHDEILSHYKRRAAHELGERIVGELKDTDWLHLPGDFRRFETDTYEVEVVLWPRDWAAVQRGEA